MILLCVSFKFYEGFKYLIRTGEDNLNKEKEVVIILWWTFIQAYLLSYSSGQDSVLAILVYQNKYVKSKEEYNLKMFIEKLLRVSVFFLILKFIWGD